MIETKYLMFESGAGGDFETYIGDTTGNIYRIDMLKVHYLNLSLDALLIPAIEAEGGIEKLRKIPNEVLCYICKSVFYAVPISVIGEIKVNAVEL
jgi:hypothetical protein